MPLEENSNIFLYKEMRNNSPWKEIDFPSKIPQKEDLVPNTRNFH